jgi:hypothetical protein
MRTMLALMTLVVAAGATLLIPRMGGPDMQWPRPPSAIGPDSRKEAWGFNLTPSRIDLGLLVNLPPPRDSRPTLTRPDVMDAADMKGIDLGIPDENWVAGVILDGRARAYPEGLLTIHECVNDWLADTPIAVTYQGLGDLLAVWRREAGGAALEFGHSGAMHEGVILFYDRRLDPHDESLWNPATGQAVTGPATGAQLARIDVTRTTWGAWRASHPDTELALPRTGFDIFYRAGAYDNYIKEGEPLHPPTRRTGRRPDLEPLQTVALVLIAGQMRGYALTDLKEAGNDGIIDKAAGGRLRVTLSPGGLGCEAAWLVAPPGEGPPPAIARGTAAWSVFDAQWPEAPIYTP